jgi:hypothetical protein
MCLFAALYLGNHVFYGNGGRSTAFSWVEKLGAMLEQWKGRFWWPKESMILGIIIQQLLILRETLQPGSHECDLILARLNEGAQLWEPLRSSLPASKASFVDVITRPLYTSSL